MKLSSTRSKDERETKKRNDNSLLNVLTKDSKAGKLTKSNARILNFDYETLAPGSCGDHHEDSQHSETC